MRELDPRQFDRILPLVPDHKKAGHMAFVHAMIEGRMAGAVFVDDAVRPRSALACNASGFWLALGEPRSDLVEEALPGLVNGLAGVEPSLLFGGSEGWTAVLASLFEGPVLRTEFQHAPIRASSARPDVPAGFELRPIDEGIARQFDGRVDPWVVRIWGGPERFVRDCFGYAVLQDGVLASFCTACGIGGSEAEVEVGTAMDSRRQGLAFVVCDAFMRECERRGLAPSWTCDSGNEPSQRLARSLGFVAFREVTGYRVVPGMRRVGGRWLAPAAG